MNKKVTLSVDGASITLNEFVQKIIGNGVLGIMQSLDDIPPDPSVIEISIKGETQVSLMVDGNAVRMNDFVRKITRNIVSQMSASLEGIPESPGHLVLTVSKMQEGRI